MVYGLYPSASVSQLSQKLLSRFLSNFSPMLTWDEPEWKWTLLKKMTFSDFFNDFFYFSLTLDPMGTKTLKRYSSLKSL